MPSIVPIENIWRLQSSHFRFATKRHLPIILLRDILPRCLWCFWWPRESLPRTSDSHDMAGKLRVAIIGSQMRHPDTPMTYTVYRTSVNCQGLCYHRLIRYRQFRYFAKHLELSSDSAPISAKFPPKIWWSRKASIRPEIVEMRQVLLNEFMQQVCTRSLTTQSKERLLKMLQVGKFAPQEEKDRVVDSRLGSEQQSLTVGEHTSDEQDYNHLSSLRKEEVSNYDEEGQSEASRNEAKNTDRAMQVRNETEDRPAQRSDCSPSVDMITVDRVVGKPLI